MIIAELSRGESQEALIRRFLRKVKKSELLKEVWERQYYKKPSVKKNEQKRRKKRVLEKLKRERELEEQQQ